MFAWFDGFSALPSRSQGGFQVVPRSLLGSLLKLWECRLRRAQKGPVSMFVAHLLTIQLQCNSFGQIIWVKGLIIFPNFSKVFALHLGQKLNSNHCRFYIVFVVQLFLFGNQQQMYYSAQTIDFMSPQLCMLTYPLLSR